MAAAFLRDERYITHALTFAHGSRRELSTMSVAKCANDVKRLVLVRHGEVDLAMFNGKKCLYGGIDIPLSEKGRAEARAAAAVLADEEHITQMWTSPLSRAVYGADCIAEVQEGMHFSSSNIVRHDGFREVDRGDWVGLSLEEIGKDKIARWNRDPSYKPGGSAETLAEVAERVLHAKDELLTCSPWGSTTALVSHMWVTRSILGEALGFDTVHDTARLQEVDLPTASISVIEYKRAPGKSEKVCSASVIYTGKKPALLDDSLNDAFDLS